MAVTHTPAVTDFGQYSKLRVAAKTQDPEALRAAAKQFEALFTQQLLKAMRAAELGEDIMGGEQTEFYQDLFDQQLAVHMSAGKGLGLAEALIQQMQKSTGLATAPAAAADKTAATPATPGLRRHEGPALSAAPAAPPASAATSARTAFVRELWPHAEKAAQSLGVSPRTLIAQAALETDWGRRMIQKSDGSSSLNFFGIKADKRWDGARTHSATSEYVNGQKQTDTAQFRAYGSVAESFDDYVRFVRENPRYREALAHGGSDQHYAQGLQRAGYATDPQYAAKIEKVAGSSALQQALPAPRRLSL